MSNFLVIAGPSGAGKSTLIKHILEDNMFKLSVSYTTRDPRPGEEDGVHYMFISKEDFQEKLRTDQILEHTIFNGNNYGTPSCMDRSNRIRVLDVEYEGVLFFKRKYPDCYMCLITADRKTLEERLSKRMINDFGAVNREEIDRRMDNFQKYEELRNDGYFEYVIVNNDLNESIQKVKQMAQEVIQRHFG